MFLIHTLVSCQQIRHNTVICMVTTTAQKIKTAEYPEQTAEYQEQTACRNIDRQYCSQMSATEHIQLGSSQRNEYTGCNTETTGMLSPHFLAEEGPTAHHPSTMQFFIRKQASISQGKGVSTPSDSAHLKNIEQKSGFSSQNVGYHECCTLRRSEKRSLDN